MRTHLHTLIMAGGSGTRFWPASRRSLPKQLLPLAPGADRSLLESTIQRMLPLCPAERILVVTGERLLAVTRAAVSAYPGVRVIAEPVARNTAPCLGWGTAILARDDADAVVVALPSDHHVKHEDAFRAAVERAVESAAAGPITTIGIRPDRPETGFGHIEASDAIGDGVRRAVRFVEKPDLQRAEEYAKSGRHFWNSGMFFYRASALRDAIGVHLPALASGLDRIEAASLRGPEAEDAETRAVFPSLPNISIDYGIMEKLPLIHVVPAEFGWSDVGSWQAAWELGQKDAAGNVGEGAVFVEASGNLVRDSRVEGRPGRGPPRRERPLHRRDGRRDAHRPAGSLAGRAQARGGARASRADRQALAWRGSRSASGPSVAKPRGTSTSSPGTASDCSHASLAGAPSAPSTSKPRASSSSGRAPSLVRDAAPSTPSTNTRPSLATARGCVKHASDVENAAASDRSGSGFLS